VPLANLVSSKARPSMARLGAQYSTASPSEVRLVPTVLALDLGTNAGWAICGGDDRIASGTESFEPRHFEGGDKRYLRFRCWLEELTAAADALALLH
jgi:hypothetical protein